jgi:hypothetical protein
MLAEAQWELENLRPTYKAGAVICYVNRHLRSGHDPLTDQAYLSRLQRLMAAS